MTKKRRRPKPEQIVRAIQEGEAMLAAGKSEAEVFQTLEIWSAPLKRMRVLYEGSHKEIFDDQKAKTTKA